VSAGTQRLRSIDTLRGVAALGVAVAHAFSAGPYGVIWPRAAPVIAEGLRLAKSGVPLFFVISGFCIHLQYARSASTTGHGTFRFKTFWRRRIWRLYPTYLLVLCGCMALVALFYRMGIAPEWTAPYPEPKARWIGLDFAAHLFMLHGLHPVFDHAGGNGVFWTLAREEYLYVLYPVILGLSLFVGRLWMVTLLAVLSMGIQRLDWMGLPRDWQALIAQSVFVFWIQWYLGALSADAYSGRVRLPAVFRSWMMIPAWIAAALALPAVEVIFFGLAYFTAVNACVQREQSGRWPDDGPLRIFRSVGLFSYSLYLVHFPVQTALYSLSLRIGAFMTPGLFLLRVTALVSGSLFVAWILFVFVESRCISQSQTALRGGLVPTGSRGHELQERKRNACEITTNERTGG